MTRITRTILLTAALSTALTAGLAPVVASAETATGSATLTTIKSDRGGASPKLAAILASIAAESDS